VDRSYLRYPLSSTPISVIPPSTIYRSIDTETKDDTEALQETVIIDTAPLDDKPTLSSYLSVDIRQTLTEIAQPFSQRVQEFQWQSQALASLANTRFPKSESLIGNRSRVALKCWSRALDFLKNRNWPSARDEFISLSGLIPAAIEPVWGAAYAASQLGDPIFALAVLQHRGHLLAAKPDLVRAEISIALQIRALPTAIRLMRTYTASPVGLSTEFILFACQHGLYRQVVSLLADEASLWADYGSAMSAYLLLKIYDEKAQIASEYYQQNGYDGLVLDHVFPILLAHSKDQPSQVYENAVAVESTINPQIKNIQNELNEAEQSVIDESAVGSYLVTINSACREGDYDKALELATKALSQSNSRLWKDRFRLQLEEIKKSQPIRKSQPFHDTDQPGPWLKKYIEQYKLPSGNNPDIREINPKRTNGPLWQQAADAAVNGELQKSIQLYQQYLKDATKGSWDNQADRALNGLAMVYQRRGQREEAIKIMLQYRNYVKEQLRFHNQIATLYYIAGQFEKAADHFNQATKVATNPIEKQKAQKNVQNARERAKQALTGLNQRSVDHDEYAEELAREYLELDLNAPVRMPEVTFELDPFLEPDIERLLKDGAEVVGIDRSRVAREDFDYETGASGSWGRVP
jgi:tetratricopeptide (TPR) repeat protein